MDIVSLINEYLSQNPSQDEDGSFNSALVELGDSSGWRFNDIPMPTMEQLQSLQAGLEQKLSQEQINKDSRDFLASSDWKVIKYRDQLDLGINTDLSIQEYQELLQLRQNARDLIK